MCADPRQRHVDDEQVEVGHGHARGDDGEDRAEAHVSHRAARGGGTRVGGGGERYGDRWGCVGGLVVLNAHGSLTGELANTTDVLEGTVPAVGVRSDPRKARPDVRSQENKNSRSL